MSLTLLNDRFEATVRPEVGGSVASFGWRAGKPILMPVVASNARADGGGCFPLVPFSNRIRDRRFRWDGKTHLLEPNVPDGRRVVHGFGWRAAWQVVERDEDRVVLEHGHDGGLGWSWRYQCLQTIELFDEGLRLDLRVTNLSGSDMPLGLGFHPFFPLDGGSRVAVIAGAARRVGPDGFPEEAGAPGSWRGERAKPEASRYLSDIQGPMIVTGEFGRVEVHTSPELGEAVLYVPPDRAFFCLEPTTHRVGDLRDEEGSGAGMRRVGGGEAWGCSTVLQTSQLER